MASHIHCSQGSDRNWTDPISNWTGLSGVDVFRDQKWFITRGRLPSQMFAAFAHEFTHHWCFHSPVGAAIAYLRLRARTRAKAVSGLHPASEEFRTGAAEVLDDLLRSDVALKLMRPFAEGLAQYAEYDLLPGQSRLISETAKCIFQAFLPVKMPFVGDEEMLTILTGIISDNRMGEKLRERKENLLVSSLECDEGGYLAGYMVVKNLRFLLLTERKCTALLDQDHYLGFMRSFIYEDYGFVDELLDSDRLGYDSVQAVSVYFQRRLSHVAANLTNDMLEQFEKFVLEQQGRTLEERELPIVLSEPAAVERGKARLDRLRKAASPYISRDDMWRVAQRSIICVGRFRDRVKVTETGFVEAITNPEIGTDMPPEMPRWAFKTGALPGTPPGEGQGSISFFICLGPAQYRAVAVHLDDRLVVATIMPHDVSDSAKEHFLSFQTSYDKAAAQDDLAEKGIDQVVADAGLTEELLHFRENVSWVANKFYKQRALLLTPDENLDSVEEDMRQDGLLHVLDDDLGLIEALARLGLLNSISWDKVFLAKYFPSGLQGLQAAVDRIKECQQRSGVRLIDDFGNALYVHV
ncbi:hypothetical protein NKH99_25100 [Mesorhizobium sp. M0854]|uniref:hypothetical protein n=1 Tax=Mesorhizobium sp. M0854 TaxID=2957013 RepID=UPI0033373F02